MDYYGWDNPYWEDYNLVGLDELPEKKPDDEETEKPASTNPPASTEKPLTPGGVQLLLQNHREQQHLHQRRKHHRQIKR